MQGNLFPKANGKCMFYSLCAIVKKVKKCQVYCHHIIPRDKDDSISNYYTGLILNCEKKSYDQNW